MEERGYCRAGGENETYPEVSQIQLETSLKSFGLNLPVQQVLAVRSSSPHVCRGMFSSLSQNSLQNTINLIYMR